MADTLKEFLVGLGFSVDEGSLKKFVTAVDSVAVPIVKLGAVVAATSVEIAAMVEHVSREMQQLYYASQRTGVAAQSLQAMGYAAKQLGLDAGAGIGVMESFSRAIRVNPGNQALLAQLGGTFQTINGQVGLTDDGLKQVLGTLKEMPRYQALMFGSLLGVDQDTLNTLLNNLGEFNKKQAEATELNKAFGLNLDDATKKGNEFSQASGKMEQALGALTTRIATDFEPYALSMVQTVTDLTIVFGKWNDKMGGTPGMIATIVASLGAAAASVAVLAKIPGFGWLSSVLGGAGTGAGVALSVAGPAAAAGIVMQPSATNAGEDAYMLAHPEKYAYGKKTTTSTQAPALMQDAIDYFMSQGWTRAQAIGIAQNLQSESGMNPGATGDGGQAYGLGQWHPDRQANFAKWAGHSIMGSSAQEQLAFAQHELDTTETGAADKLRATRNARDATVAFALYDERPGGGYAEAARRGDAAAGVSINQTNHVSVTGVKDPDQAAKKVGEAQAGVNDSLMQNFTPKVR